MSSSLTVQSVVNYASTHTELMPLAGVGGFTSEPAMSLAQDTLGEILSPPFAWKWNRKTANLMVTQMNRQDYKFAGAVAFALSGGTVVGGVGIELKSNTGVSEASNTVTVKTLEDHNFSVGQTVYMAGNDVAAYNSTQAVTPSGSSWSGGWTILTVPDSKTFTFTHASSGLATSGSAGITDFGWLEYATMVDENDLASPRFVRRLQATRTLEPSSRTGIPEKITVSESGTAGVLAIRFVGVPSSAAWGVTLAYQAKAPFMTDLTGTWSPIPDEFAFMVRQVFLAHAYRYFNSTRADQEYMKAQQAIGKALGRDDAEESEEYIAPTRPLMGYGLGW